MGTRESIRSHLDSAHFYLQSGDIESALDCVIVVLRLSGANMELLNAVQRLKRESNAEGREITKDSVEQMIHLFSTISLENEKKSSLFENHKENELLINEERKEKISQCILAETGREGINMCALEDGSSFMCDKCGAIIPVSRKAAHQEYWCQGP